MKLDMDINKEISDLDLSSPILDERKSASRFIITSGLVHIIAATAILITNHIPQNEIEKELVEIDFSAPAEMNSAPEQAALPEQVATLAAVQTVTPETAKTPKANEPVIETSAMIPEPQQDLVQKAVENPPQPTPKPIPVLTQKQIAPTQKAVVAANLNPQDLDQELDQVDEQNNKDLLAAADQIKADTQQAEEALDQSAELAAQKIKNEEQAAAEKLAAATKTQEGSGEKNVGPGEISTEVRALDQLRQMPGNPKPLYDSQERLRGDKGVVVFQAFVTQEGLLKDFKLLKSSGHRNLDAKTLKALKQWKFYPGQEGEVELPFDWSLKGGPQEMPAFLRRKVDQRP